MNASAAQPRIGYILRSYPRLSQTFILHEILTLEQFGFRLDIFAVTNPREDLVQAEVSWVQAPVHYLEEAKSRGIVATAADHLALLLQSPSRYIGAFGYVLGRGHLDRGYTASSRFECFRQAVYLARLLSREGKESARRIEHLHAHFAHDPTLIAMLTHMLTGIPYSFTAHARDLYQIPAQDLVERVKQASAVVTCCAANIDYLNAVEPEGGGGKVHLVHHGVDLRNFHPAEGEIQSGRVGTPLIVSAGRLVEKKGFIDLLDACAILKREGHRFRCEIYGEGPMRDQLLNRIERLGLSGEVSLAGAVTQQELVPVLQAADIFVLTPFVTGDGDRDGVPNVLVEAMACGLPVVSTNTAGVPELVQDGCNGLLAAPHDVEGIAVALASLLEDTWQRKWLGDAARRTVTEKFDVIVCTRHIASLFDSAMEVSNES